MSDTIKVISEFHKGLNLTPEHHRYAGSWANVNRCKECELTGLYGDMHTNNPCPNCGGKVMSGYVARWTGTWKSGFFKSGWSEGEWEMRKGMEK